MGSAPGLRKYDEIDARSVVFLTNFVDLVGFFMQGMSIIVVFVGIVGILCKKCRLSSRFFRHCQSQFVLNTKEVEKKKETGGAVEEKVDSNLGVEGSNSDRDLHFCKIFGTAKTDDSYV